jgi:hypothetical protein
MTTTAVPRDEVEDVLARALTGYALTAGERTPEGRRQVPAVGVAPHLAAYLADRGYRLVRTDHA